MKLWAGVVKEANIHLGNALTRALFTPSPLEQGRPPKL